MNLAHTATTVLLFAGLATLWRGAADAQVMFLSRSGKVSTFAAGVHGYGHPAPSSIAGSRASQATQHIEFSDVRRPVWRETSLYEFQPAQVIRHGDHYDILPGRYRIERHGSWE